MSSSQFVNFLDETWCKKYWHFLPLNRSFSFFTLILFLRLISWSFQKKVALQKCKHSRFFYIIQSQPNKWIPSHFYIFNYDNWLSLVTYLLEMSQKKIPSGVYVLISSYSNILHTARLFAHLFNWNEFVHYLSSSWVLRYLTLGLYFVDLCQKFSSWRTPLWLVVYILAKLHFKSRWSGMPRSK